MLLSQGVFRQFYSRELTQDADVVFVPAVVFHHRAGENESEVNDADITSVWLDAVNAQ